jgi:uncharacterized membrane protein
MKLHRWQIPDTKEIILIIPNFFFRFIHLIVSITVIISAIKFYKKDKTTSLFFLSIMIYFIGLTSLVASYDRYRLPFESIISFYLTYFIYNFKEIYSKNSN